MPDDARVNDDSWSALTYKMPIQLLEGIQTILGWEHGG